MNKLLQRTINGQNTILNSLFLRPSKYFQSLMNKKEKYVPPGPPDGEWDYIEAQTLTDARNLGKYLENRTLRRIQ